MVELRLYVGDLEQEDYLEIEKTLNEKLDNGEKDYLILDEEPDNKIKPLTGDMPYLSVVNDTLEKPHSVDGQEDVDEVLNNIDKDLLEQPETAS